MAKQRKTNKKRGCPPTERMKKTRRFVRHSLRRPLASGKITNPSRPAHRWRISRRLALEGSIDNDEAEKAIQIEHRNIKVMSR